MDECVFSALRSWSNALENYHFTVLDPLLFLLHINDLPSVVSSKVRLFADDCFIYRNIKNKEDQITLQKDINLLENWGNTWEQHTTPQMSTGPF